MSLPKIVESEPWLEDEDDDFYVKTCKKSNKCESVLSLTNIVKLLKAGVYLYILVGLMIKTNVSRDFFIKLKALLATDRFHSPLIISILIALTSIIQNKYLQ